MNWIQANQLKSNNPETRKAAGLKIATQSADAILRDVTKILESKSAEMRIGGLYVAIAMKPHAGRRIVTSVLTDASPDVRIEALKTLRELKATDYGSEIYQCLNDAEDAVILEAIATAIELNEDASASYLASLLDHPSKKVRMRTFISARKYWKYEHLEKLRLCLKKADIGYADEVNNTIQSIEFRSKELAKALEKGGTASRKGMVQKPMFRSAMTKRTGVSPAQSQSVPDDAIIMDQTDFEALDGFTGFIKEVGLQDLIQLACVNRKSQAFEITTSDGVAKIYVCEGEIVHAKFAQESGQDALFKILAFQKGKFKEVEYTDPDERTIHAPWEFLLMEAARIHDESGAVPGDL